MLHGLALLLRCTALSASGGGPGSILVIVHPRVTPQRLLGCVAEPLLRVAVMREIAQDIPYPPICNVAEGPDGSHARMRRATLSGRDEDIDGPISPHLSQLTRS